MKTKLKKYLILFLTLGIIAIGLYYLNLPNRHRAIIKTTLLHKLKLVDNTWNIGYTDSSTTFISPTFVVDNIYKSMEGPQALGTFQIDPNKSELVWLNSFKISAIRINELDSLPKDYICHSNLDYYDGEHYGKWELFDRIGKYYPRLTSMSSGIEEYKFPEGFGFPIFTDENIFLSTQTLNHNLKNTTFSLKHKIDLGFRKHSSNMKPLISKSLFIALPYENEPNKIDYNSISYNSNSCLPVDTENHVYLNHEGKSVSGHWFIPTGKSTYRSKVTHQLNLKDSTTLHFMIPHLHPFAEKLEFRDVTNDSTIFTSLAKNHIDKIGLNKVSYYSSKKGYMLSPEHEYELVVYINNTSNKIQDMMASVFAFMYDKDMATKIPNSMQTND